MVPARKPDPGVSIIIVGAPPRPAPYINSQVRNDPTSAHTHATIERGERLLIF